MTTILNRRSVIASSLLAIGAAPLGVLVGRNAPPTLFIGGRSDVPARRAARGEEVELAIKVRRTPVAVESISGLEGSVTDEDLIQSLCASLPWWNPPTVPALMHELKLWGPNAVFDKGMVRRRRTGADMVAILLSDELCRERTTPDGTNYLLDSPFGIRVALGSAEETTGTRAETHFGQLLMTLGQAGVPLETPVATASGRTGTVADLAADAILRFSWNGELEFIATALALWLPPESTWSDQFANRYSFDTLVHHLTALPFGIGACGGTHVPYAVVTILRSDEHYGLLSASARKSALRYLSELARRLERSERRDGGWDSSWSGGATANGLYGNRLLDEINITGHHLEWIALAPPSVRPKSSIITSAVRALTALIKELPSLNRRVFKALLPCSHAARALCLMKGVDPFQRWKQFWDAGTLEHLPPWGGVGAGP